MEDADSGEDAPREVVGETGAEPGVAASAASASGTAGEPATEPVPADGGHDAGDEEEGGADVGTQEVRKDPLGENLERLLKERRDQRTRTTALRKEIKKAQKQRARIKKNATRLTDEDIMAVIRARGIDPTAQSSSG